MKELIENTNSLRALSDYCQKNTSALQESLLSLHRSKVVPSQFSSAFLNEEQKNFTANKSARCIQRFWRASKMKESLAQDSYRFYTSLISPEDPLKPLFDTMFDLHVAELAIYCKDRSKNPLANQNGGYHRQNASDKKMLEKLLMSFGISQDEMEKSVYIPVFLLVNSPIETIISQYCRHPRPDFTLLKKSNKSIALVAMAKDNPYVQKMQMTLAAAGILASLWEITQNITDQKNIMDDARQATSYAAYIPTTKEKLLKSIYFGRLKLIAESSRHPTHLLAACLCKLIQNAPELSQTAACRIALLLEITITFYAHHYSKFAFCVYAVVHEISLLLLTQSSDEMKMMYAEFYKESEATLLKSLDVEGNQLENHIFFTAPAISGANAYIIAMQLASKMQTGAQPPTIKIIKPSYYEFDFITESTTNTDPDIIVFCAGPIVNRYGLVPGIDINRFVRNHILSNPHHKAVTLVIDATTALYKNLKLDPDIKAVVEKGLVSIIVHESHQKFGLLHTDQAQYGRVFAFCSKANFNVLDTSEIQHNTELDFYRHIDMRIGAFINVICADHLEKIKEQHFKNGVSWGTTSVPSNEDMLTNPNDMYFYVLSNTFIVENAIACSIQSRDSFGHYSTTAALVAGQIRISPDASDMLDTLVQAAKCAIALKHSSTGLETMVVKNGRSTQPLALEHQIICCAILHNIAQYNNPNDLALQIEKATAPMLKKSEQLTYNSYKETVEVDKEQLLYYSSAKQHEMIDFFQKMIEMKQQFMADYEGGPLKKLELLAAMNTVFKQCTLLAGRSLYMSVGRYLAELRQEIIEEYHPDNASLFFKAVNVLYIQNISFKDELLKQLKSSQLFCRKIIEQPSIWEEHLQDLADLNSPKAPISICS